jgi:hypothetical protein
VGLNKLFRVAHRGLTTSHQIPDFPLCGAPNPIYSSFAMRSGKEVVGQLLEMESMAHVRQIPENKAVFKLA